LRRAGRSDSIVLPRLAAATSLFGQGQNKAQDLKKAQREVQQGEKAEAAGHWTTR